MREILEYFSSATQIGLTATPKETEYVSNIHYFGKPVYQYSLKQGISDGFLAPTSHQGPPGRGHRRLPPQQGELDKYGCEIDDRLYNQKDFDRDLLSTSAPSAWPASQQFPRTAATVSRRPSYSASIPNTPRACVRRHQREPGPCSGKRPLRHAHHGRRCRRVRPDQQFH